MSELTIILPGDWVELDAPGLVDHVTNNIGLQQLQDMINDSSWPSITMQLEDFWVPPEGMSMVGMRIFSESVVRLFVQLA